MLTILSWFWQQPNGRASYTADTVNAWAKMVRKHITLPHRIACVTDFADGIDSSIDIITSPRDFEDVRIPTWNERKPQCLRRLSMYSPNAGEIFGDRFVCMDLDCIVSDSLDPLFDVPADFKMMEGTAPKQRPYNGSMTLMTAGARPQVYTEFTPGRAAEAGRHFIGSDQAWIGFCLGWGEQTWGADDGALWYSPRYSSAVDPCRVMFFPGAQKPWTVAGSTALDRFVKQHYPEKVAA